MPFEICPARQSILDAQGPVLVTGGPGSGKTTIALLKALRRIDAGVETGQGVLFLSFSRAAVARVVEASKNHLPSTKRGLLSIHTFHSFFWDLLQAFGYLLGAPRHLTLLAPHDETALRRAYESNGGDWDNERHRLFVEEGRVAFDLFAPLARKLLVQSQRLRSLWARQYPLIVVDEAQDTAEDQWESVRLLSEHSQLVCLADLDQQIYDFRPGVSAERVTDIMAALNPLRVDLEGQNHRSPGCEIVAFGNDMLLNAPRGTPYRGVNIVRYRPTASERDARIRSSIAIVRRAALQSDPNRKLESMAFLTTGNRGVAMISRALAGDGTNAIPHHVPIDEAPVLLASRCVAFLLEPKRAGADELLDLSEGLNLAAAVFSSKKGNGNLNQGQSLARDSVQAGQGRAPRRNSIAAKLLDVIRRRRTAPFLGDPKKDWTATREFLRASAGGPLVEIANHAESLFAFQRGKRISMALTDSWQTLGSYRVARRVLDATLAQDQILSGFVEPNGIHVMTAHKSKGKEFDVVVLFDEPNGSAFVLRDDGPPHPKSRRLIRVAITRARHQVLILANAFELSDLLRGHNL